MPLAVSVTLPADASEIRWELRYEDGTARQGIARVADLPVEAERVCDGVSLARCTLTVDGPQPHGYHRVQVDGPGIQRSDATVIVTPSACYLPRALQGEHGIWGVAAQLYALRSTPDWGIGDFGALRGLMTTASGWGADIVGVNPLHAMFLDLPEEASPYSPASRLFLNAFYIDVDAARDLLASEHGRATAVGVAARRRTPPSRNSWTTRPSRAVNSRRSKRCTKISAAVLTTSAGASSRPFGAIAAGRWKSSVVFRPCGVSARG